MEIKLTNADIRRLKARGQLMDPSFKVGKAGLSEGFVKSLSEAFAYNDLIKVKFVEFKEEKKVLALELAQKTSSRLVMQVGNVIVLYRPKPETSTVTSTAPVTPTTASTPHSTT